MAREIPALSPEQIVNLSSRGGSATCLESGGLWRPHILGLLSLLGNNRHSGTRNLLAARMAQRRREAHGLEGTGGGI